ncbi:hypothetical protein BCR42DRAFT_411486 [Absidia repens]|uniref:Yeast cell wall synthesis Kre9/Knh1-like N-terminal domain-containing protein n=1 Tax=Absidia repens TaxID=90262 RepID=A0A1X2ILS8_9FUNG|nr:hypothetical protein BCR42DRAFT_411486 [Absidia repens]
MKSSFIALFFAFVALVAAQSTDSPFYITYPLSGASLKAGESIDLTWINGLDQKVKVTVIQGADSKTMSPTGISFNVNGDDESYTWTVPKSLAAAGTYAFQFEFKNNGATQYSYSGPVSVTGGTGTISSQSATATASSSAPAKSSSSAVSSASSSAAVSSSSSSAAVSSSSSAASSTASSNTVSASSTPSPTNNSAAGIKITSIVLAVPALVLAALYA